MATAKAVKLCGDASHPQHSQSIVYPTQFHATGAPMTTGDPKSPLLSTTMLSPCELPFAVFKLANDGEITYSNRQALAMLGYSEEEMLGKSILQIDVETFIGSSAVDRYLMGGQERRSFETRYAQFNGDVLHVSVTLKRCEQDPKNVCWAFVEDNTRRFERQQKMSLISAGIRDSIAATLIAQVKRDDKNATPVVTYANEAFKLMSGYDDESAITDTPAILSGPGTSQSLLNLIRKQLIEKQPLRHEILAYGKHKTKFWAEISLSPIKGWLEKDYWMIVYRDITNRKLSEKRFAELRDSLKVMVQLFATTDGVWDWDIEKDSVEYQSGYRLILGYAGNDLVGVPNTMNSFSTRLHPEDRDRVLSARQQSLQSKQPFEQEFRLQRKNGTYIWVHDRGSVLYDDSGNPIRMAGSIYDITLKKQIEQDLATERAMLKRSNADLEQFASVASHDLQEPLRAIAGFMELLKRRDSHLLDTKSQGYIEKSIQGAGRLEQLINDLLHFSKVTRDDSRVVQINLDQCVAYAIGNLERLIEETSATVESDKLPSVMGIGSQLNQLIQNLIENGIKYRREEDPIIRISGRTVDDHVEIRIADNGIGIRPEFHQQVFTLFQRLHHREQYKGTGIGLAVCRRIAERHGGTITIEDNNEDGTCFLVRLPKQA